MAHQSDRRRFLKLAGASAVACAAASPRDALAAGRSEPAPTAPFTLGMASYTLRLFPVDQAIEMTKRLGLTRICFKDFHLKLDATPDVIAETLAKVKAAGLDLYAGGVIYMKSEAEVDRAFAYAKAAGMRMIIGVPTYELLPYTSRKVQEYDLPVAIHNHGPDNPLFPTPQSAYERIASLDRRLGLCMDVGHTERAGVDPAESAEKYFDRLFDVHIKDVSASTAQGRTVEIGRGVIDIPRLLRTLTRLKFAGTLALEHEKDEKDPLPGCAESIGYLRGVIATLA
ncbi:MAG: sugar phosphate isomerase/epimerase [Vicinamibacterales bacterium]